MKIRNSFFFMMHNTTRKKIENKYLKIQNYLQVELSPKMNILSVM